MWSRVLLLLMATSLVAADTPAPDAESLIKAVVANQKQLEDSRKNYIFHRRDDVQETDDDGKVKKTEVNEYEVFFVGAWEIDRLLVKDGKPLNDSEKKKQDEQVAKEEKKARERIRKEEAGEEPDKDAITLSKFLAADRFYNLRRETIRGREVYAFDFAPRADFKPHNLSEKVLESLGGTIWIDEDARQAVRLEAHLLDGFKVGAGLASVKKGGNIIFEQEKVNGEIWMPSYGEVHLGYRILFSRKGANVVLHYSDYRKFKVESKITGYTEMDSGAKP
ncbi:hypothetical protein Acid345_1842 [Candidatus Koribacter versatilis Ellin345]|uniref:Uncharacterized protein n=2 Tax=Candidatus Korobacter versatilis TaxID=658062 RepID=Q1IQK7_KORVE|nr:hypothetical protein Acid345_1842 [Candidatus Koribacter versatilis Ellin345]